jgi:type IV pilus assembly protein PilV
VSELALIRRQPRSAGFSLLEVLVALLVLSVGLLGIAKMEALALATTATSARRSIAALEASSLAASMHANRGFWESAGASGIQVGITGTTINNLPGGTAPDCKAGDPQYAGACTAAGLAAYDLNQWAGALNQALPNDVATVQCNTTTPLECSIQIQWSEQAVAMYSAQAQSASTAAAQNAGTTAAIENPTYTLYVQP